ncbi:GNAT family N-acetyltransferase [Mesorhizobium sp. GbtcB19]|uniref:GNAT family N-acetyltransferase n=1 Tax=Mesorhizobium sp. GbtcB19 TaxID=2824764 RepID=UPI0020C64925|nr:GNAT family N-acetyltransferase [Mesorhizobium sp. GbtcB19]
MPSALLAMRSDGGRDGTHEQLLWSALRLALSPGVVSMSLVYRPARADDLAATDALVVASINELTVRHGFGPMATASPPNFQLFSLKDDPDGLWVAEDGGAILGFAWSWVCGDVWFLAQLFVDPARQGHGIGNALLERTMEHARKSGAAHKALITLPSTVSRRAFTCGTACFPKRRSIFSAPRANG